MKKKIFKGKSLADLSKTKFELLQIKVLRIWYVYNFFLTCRLDDVLTDFYEK